MKTKRLTELKISHIHLEVALFLNIEAVNSQGRFSHPQPRAAWVPPLPLLLLIFYCLQTCLVNWWQLLWYMYIYTCECMWIGCDNCYDICIWMFSDVCVVLPWNIWTISFVSGCATRKSVKKVPWQIYLWRLDFLNYTNKTYPWWLKSFSRHG